MSARPTSRMHDLLSAIVWLLPPAEFKNRLLRALGNSIGLGVRLGPTVVLGCGVFELGDGSSLGLLNIFRNVHRIELGRDAFIGGFNQITAVPEYRAVDGRSGTLHLADRAGVINRHYLDCSGRIEVGSMSMVGGIRSILQTHELDLEIDATTIGDIVIGEYCFTGTGVILLQGATMPDRSVLAAGSTRVRSDQPGPTDHLYAGSPARPVKDISGWRWLSRSEIHTPVDERAHLRGGR